MLYRHVPGRMTWTQRIISLGTHRSPRCMRLKSGHLLQPITFIICMLYLSKFHTKQDFAYPVILFYNANGIFIVHAFLPGTSKVFTLSVFLPDVWVHVLLPDTQRYTVETRYKEIWYNKLISPVPMNQCSLFCIVYWLLQWNLVIKRSDITKTLL